MSSASSESRCSPSASSCCSWGSSGGPGAPTVRCSPRYLQPVSPGHSSQSWTGYGRCLRSRCGSSPSGEPRSPGRRESAPLGRNPGHGAPASCCCRVRAVAGCLLLALLPARLAISQAHVERAIADMHAGDCANARGEARRSLDLVEQRATPQHIIAWCLLRDGRAPAAARALVPGARAGSRQLGAAGGGRSGARPCWSRSACRRRRAVLQNPQNALIREVAAAVGVRAETRAPASRGG